MNSQVDRERFAPKYAGLGFDSIQSVVMEMVGTKPSSWQEFYNMPGVKFTPHVDIAHFQSTGFKHYFWNYGYFNVERVELDIRGDGRIAPSFTKRKPGLIRVSRQIDTDQIIEVLLDYELPDVNKRRYAEDLSITLRKFPDEKFHRLVSRSVGEYSFPIPNLGLVNQFGGGVGLTNDGEGWNQQRYKKAFQEAIDLLAVKRLSYNLSWMVVI